MTLSEDIRALISERGPMTSGEVISALGVPPERKGTCNRVRQAMYQGVRSGWLARGPDGRFCVAREVRRAVRASHFDAEAFLREHGPSTAKEAADASGLTANRARAHLERAAEPVGYDGRRIVYALPGEARKRGTRLAGADVEGFLREHGPCTIAEVMKGMGVPRQTAWAALRRVAVRLEGKKPYRYALKEESQ